MYVAQPIDASARRALTGPRSVKIIALNLAIGVVIGIVFWIFQRSSPPESLGRELTASLIHAAVYGAMFGLSMPYLADLPVRFRWNWAVIGIALAAIAAISTL